MRRCPAPSQRVTPATAARFAKIVSPNTAAALRTAPGAHHWRLMFLEFPANKDGYGDIIQLGDGSTAQSQAAQVPYEIVLDRVYVHGHPLYGQKRGIALNARTVTIRNSYVADIKAVGVDAQAIGGWNGPGPFSIENNYLEASGEVFLLGGADPGDSQPGQRGRLGPLQPHVAADVVARPDRGRAVRRHRDAGGRRIAGPPGPMRYRVVARRPVGQGTMATSAAVAGDRGDVAGRRRSPSRGTPVADATEYRVYGRTPGGRRRNTGP